MVGGRGGGNAGRPRRARTGRRRGAEGPRARPRPEAHRRRGDPVRRGGGRVLPGVGSAGHGRTDRAGPAPRLVALEPIPVGPHGGLAGRALRRPRAGDRPGRSDPPLAPGVRSGADRRPQVVDGLDVGGHEGGTGHRRCRCGRPAGRRRVGPGRRPGSGRGPRAVGGASSLPGSDPDGLEGARLVPGPRPRPCPLRLQRQHRAHGVGGRSGRRRMGPMARRHRGVSAARRCRGETERAIAAAAAALTDWLGGVVVTPRFPTPIDKALRAGP